VRRAAYSLTDTAPHSTGGTAAPPENCHFPPQYVMKIQAFQVGWSAEAVARVLARVQDCQLPVSPPGSGWTLGCDIDFLRHVQAYWSAEFNWQAALARLNAYPQFIATIDDMDIHFVHVVGEAEGRRPLLL